jgi:hypothetical protein
MSHPISNAIGGDGVEGWNREQTLEMAWTTWLALLAVPFVVLPFALHMMPGGRGDGSGPRTELADRWFVIVMIYLMVALPASLLVRGLLFGGMGRARNVLPRAYYAGTLVVWLVVVVGGLVAELVCVVTGTLLPNVLPAVLALAVFMTLFPTGSAMEPRIVRGRSVGADEPGW